MIVIAPDPILHQKSEEVTKFDRNLQKLIRDMWSELGQNKSGIGLSAVQIGVLKRVLIIDTSAMPVTKENPFNPIKIVMMNPTFKPVPTILGPVPGKEGCLSFPGQEYSVKRYPMIHVKYQNLTGSKKELFLSGLNSVVFQHELDHLDGITFKDRFEDDEG